MEVLLDGETLADTSSLAEAIDTARAHAAGLGRVIIEVDADGVPIDGSLLDAPPSDAAGIARLELRSTPPGPLVRMTLYDAADVVAKAKADQDIAAELIQSGDLAGAIERLGGVVAAWSSAREALEHSLILLDIEPHSVGVRTGDGTERTADACITDLAGHLVELKRCLTEQDWAGLSDELAYEMDQQAAVWSALLTEVAGVADRSE